MKKIRTISIIEGSTASGKTSQLLDEFRHTVKHKRSILISFEEDLDNRIPAEELEAQIRCHKMAIGAFKDMSELVEKLNELIAYNNIEHIYIDTIDFAVDCKLYTPSQYYSHLYNLTSSATISIQLPRNSHVDNSQK